MRTTSSKIISLLIKKPSTPLAAADTATSAAPALVPATPAELSTPPAEAVSAISPMETEQATKLSTLKNVLHTPTMKAASTPQAAVVQPT
jgi:hypothetical protein